MVGLWTDALLWGLVLVMALGLAAARSRPELKRPFAKLAEHPSGVVALAVLLFFLSVALLDSVHYQKSGGEVLSVLDTLLTPLRDGQEKTYSAPFASQLYSSEFMETDTGEPVWGRPRLQHGGAHLSDEDHHIQDIALKLLAACGRYLGLLAIIALFVWVSWRGLQQRWRDLPALRWATWTILAQLALALVLWDVSHYYHVLGTDMVGEDVLYQTVKSIRTGWVIGALTTLIMLPLAIGFGILAGFFGGWVDDVIQYLYTTLNSIPGVLLIAAAILLVQVHMANHPENYTSLQVRADTRLLFLCLILGVTSWTGLCRLLRAETLKLREMGYVQAAFALGVKPYRILLRHILPNVMHIVIISVALDFSALVLAEAVLSYINIGVDPVTYSWGNMINGARLELAREPLVWWSLMAAFCLMFTLVLAANLFADSVRRAFDPREAEHG
ncbi:MAG: ABC transporter permease [Methylococcales bacterium]|nr:ABC transporter permease [Methylococcales bacterium]